MSGKMGNFIFTAAAAEEEEKKKERGIVSATIISPWNLVLVENGISSLDGAERDSSRIIIGADVFRLESEWCVRKL